MIDLVNVIDFDGDPRDVVDLVLRIEDRVDDRIRMLLADHVDVVWTTFGETGSLFEVRAFPVGEATHWLHAIGKLPHLLRRLRERDRTSHFIVAHDQATGAIVVVAKNRPERGLFHEGERSYSPE